MATASTTYNTPTGALPASGLQDTLALIGRIVLAWFFVPAGFGKIMGFAGTVGYATSAGLPMPQVGVAIALAIELIGGLMLLVGFKTRWAALALAVFCVVAALFFHNYWAVAEAQQMMQKLNFTKNLAIAAGLLGFAAFGAGRWSLDGRRATV
jgi:putative oxidoreductase